MRLLSIICMSTLFLSVAYAEEKETSSWKDIKVKYEQGEAAIVNKFKLKNEELESSIKTGRSSYKKELKKRVVVLQEKYKLKKIMKEYITIYTKNRKTAADKKRFKEIREVKKKYKEEEYAIRSEYVLTGYNLEIKQIEGDITLLIEENNEKEDLAEKLGIGVEAGPLDSVKQGYKKLTTKDGMADFVKGEGGRRQFNDWLRSFNVRRFNERAKVEKTVEKMKHKRALKKLNEEGSVANSKKDKSKEVVLMGNMAVAGLMMKKKRTAAEEQKLKDIMERYQVQESEKKEKRKKTRTKVKAMEKERDDNIIVIRERCDEDIRKYKKEFDKKQYEADRAMYK